MDKLQAIVNIIKGHDKIDNTINSLLHVKFFALIFSHRSLYILLGKPVIGH